MRKMNLAYAKHEKMAKKQHLACVEMEMEMEMEVEAKAETEVETEVRNEVQIRQRWVLAKGTTCCDVKSPLRYL